MPKTKLEIIQETEDYYRDSSKRGWSNLAGSCRYLTEDGNMCAFGRCELYPSELAGGDVRYRIVQILNSEGDPLDESLYDPTFDAKHIPLTQPILDAMLKPEYRGHSFIFWAAIQSLHDKTMNFANGTWSEAGLAEIKLLKERYADKD